MPFQPLWTGDQYCRFVPPNINSMLSIKDIRTFAYALYLNLLLKKKENCRNMLISFLEMKRKKKVQIVVYCIFISALQTHSEKFQDFIQVRSRVKRS